MTENTPTPAELRKLVAEARLRGRRVAGHFPGEAVSPLSTRLADALEAVIAERDARAAILAEALSITADALSNADDCGVGWDAEVSASALHEVLSKLPADALAARDARVRAEGGAAALREVANLRRGADEFGVESVPAQWLTEEADRIEREASR